jgi:hypothetical protein
MDSDLAQVADAVANVARRNAADDTYESPYTVEALRQVPITGSATKIFRGWAAATTTTCNTEVDETLSPNQLRLSHTAGHRPLVVGEVESGPICAAEWRLQAWQAAGAPPCRFSEPC